MLRCKKAVYVFLTLSLGFFHGCAPKEYGKQESAFILFKTPSFKYADLGFVYENKDEIKVEIYGSGKALMQLEITAKKICMGVLACMDKKDFNTKVLNRSYPDDLIENIFRAKAIFHAEGLQKKRNGFTQNILKPRQYDIKYTVFNKEIYFHDRINHIAIQVKRMGS